jgi:BirA family biotin operon repressor/biotin-[acetyl-CoA-carboxylase] ligase
LRALLSDLAVDGRLEIVDTTRSTNDDARRLAAAGAPSGTVVVANAQSSGRGRMGRSWHSARGLGIYVSVLFRPSHGVEHLTRWTLASALAGCESCLDAAGLVVDIEWPNDLYHEGRKLGGCLTELRSVGGSVREVIVGTGFNVNHAASDFPQSLAGRATSLARARGGVKIDREALAAAYVSRLGSRIRDLERGAWSELREAWYRRAPRARGRAVCVRRPEGQGEFHGVTRGVDDAGALQVEHAEDGSIVTLRPGEAIVLKEA